MTAVILACGPSLKQHEVDYCKGKATVYAVNNAYSVAIWADYLYACDYDWWKYYKPEFAGQKWTQDEKAAKEFGLNYIRGKPNKAFSLEPSHIATGGNSGFQALNLAVLHGHKRILLLGFDYKNTGKHFFGAHPGSLNKHPDMRLWVDRMNKAAPIIKSAGVEVINCNHQSAIHCFKFEKLADCL